MTKEEIEKELNETCLGAFNKQEIFKKAFNLGLQIASEVVEADLEILSDVAKMEMYGLEAGVDYEIGINRGSILKYKL